LKAVDPVIAVLILIAIAVIAGVFVLRQFLAFAGQTGQQYVNVEDAVFFKTTDPFGEKITIRLQIKVRNVGDRQVRITDIEVRDAGWKASVNYTGWTEILLSPGDSWSFSATIFENEPYTAAWETGTTHQVVVHYMVAGNPNPQSVGYPAKVM